MGSFAKAETRRQNEKFRAEITSLKQQVKDLQAQVNVGEKPLRQRIEQLETRCKKLRGEVKTLPHLQELIRKADALSAAVLAEFEYVIKQHPEAATGFSCPYFQKMESARNAYEEEKEKQC